MKEQPSIHPEILEWNTEAERIKKLLDINERLLENKIVLDLGSGPEAYLAKEFQGNKKIKITSVDVLPPDNKTMTDYIQADAATLPFEDESFDLIISAGGPIGLSENKEESEKRFKEALRVLKKGGELRIGRGWNASVVEPPPDDLNDEARDQYFNKKWFDFLESLGFSQVEQVQKGKNITSFYNRLIK